MRWIVVLGMHRSGTSAFTHAVASLGATLGTPAHYGKHGENVRLRRINERLLRASGGWWDAPPPAGWLSDAATAAPGREARQFLEADYGHVDAAVWKDPRTCLTVPFWEPILGVEPLYLFIYRHPSEVAASLTTRNGMGAGHGHALWERYNADALRAIDGRAAVVISYDTLLADPVGQLGLVAEAAAMMGITVDHDVASAEHGLVAIERHHTAGAQDALASVATPQQQELYALLGKLVGFQGRLEVASRIPEPHPLSEEVLEMARTTRRLRANAAKVKGRRPAKRSGGPVSGGPVSGRPVSGGSASRDPASEEIVSTERASMRRRPKRRNARRRSPEPSTVRGDEARSGAPSV